ncbi:MAG: J domain-containing protein [Gammaproteobacteria bacterium]
MFGERFNGAVHDYDKDFHVELGIDLEDAACGAERRLELSLPYESAPRTVAVRIPRGIRAEQRIRLKGLGKPGRNGAAAGDIYARVFFKPHRQFAVEGGNLLLTLPVAPWEAALGETVEVPTLGGTVNLKIPPNSKNGQKLRLKGKGLPASGKEPAGDLFARLEIALPPADAGAQGLLSRNVGGHGVQSTRRTTCPLSTEAMLLMAGMSFTALRPWIRRNPEPGIHARAARRMQGPWPTPGRARR